MPCEADFSVDILPDIFIVIVSDIKFDDRNILHKTVPFIIHREIIERKLVTLSCISFTAQKSASSGDCIFQNFDDHFFIRQRIAQSVK